MAKVKGVIVVDIEKCKGCEICRVACPNDVIAMAQEVNHKGYHYAFQEHQEDCVGCPNCAIVCPDGVITVYKIKLSD